MEATLTTDAEITVSKRAIYPYKVGVKQFESGTTTLKFKLDNYKYDEHDLRNYKAFVFTSINGFTDITELSKNIVDGQLELTWVVSAYTLRYAGAITYQIVFKEDVKASTAVFNTYEAILQCSESVDAERAIQAEYPTIFKQWYDLIQSLAGTYDAEVIYMPVGEPIPYEERLAGRLYYQVLDATTYEGRFEDHNGKRLGEFNAKHVADANLNTLLENGEYVCAGTLSNIPIASTFCTVHVTDSAATNRVIQEVRIPADDNTVRVFVRAVTAGSTFGAWRELGSADYITSLLDDKDFEIKSLMNYHSKDLLDFYIETFDSTSALSTIPDGYDSRLHLFNINGACEMVFNSKTVSSARTQFWINVEATNSSAVTRQISVDGGSTWVTATNNAMTTISSATSFIVKLKFSSSLTLKNVAFGLK